jgi:hypothetical protein
MPRATTTHRDSTREHRSRSKSENHDSSCNCSHCYPSRRSEHHSGRRNEHHRSRQSRHDSVNRRRSVELTEVEELEMAMAMSLSIADQAAANNNMDPLHRRLEARPAAQALIQVHGRSMRYMPRQPDRVRDPSSAPRIRTPPGVRTTVTTRTTTTSRDVHIETVRGEHRTDRRLFTIR